MGYGKEFKINGVDYLLEINETYIYVAKKISEDSYEKIYETEDYSNAFWKDELAALNSMPSYDDQLYAIINKVLEYKGIINNMASYQKFIINMIDDSMPKEDILNSGSDEVHVYLCYFPLDWKAEKFKQVTSSIIDGYLQNKNNFK